MRHRNRLHHFIFTLFIFVLASIISSCGTVEPTTNANNPAANNPAANNPSGIASPVAHKHDQADAERHLRATNNVQGLLDGQDTRAMKAISKPTATVSYNPPLRPLFAGSTRVDMKLLIISAEGANADGGNGDPMLDAITFFAKEIGIPYDVLIAREESLTEDRLLNNGDGKYQGIITTDVNLGYDNGNGAFVSAFNEAEWNLLWQYAREFNVRQIALSGFPGTSPEDYGLRNIPGLESTAESTAQLTAQGASIFNSLKSTVSIPIKFAFTLQAELCGAACPNITTTPILLNQNTGNVLGAVTEKDGREILSLTMTHNQFLTHSGLMAYDLINWITKGVFIGERRMYFTIDIDDHYLASAIWNPATNSNFPLEGPNTVTYRISATDLYAARDGVENLRSRFNTNTFNYNQVFNADKADPFATLSCADNASLSSATLCVKDFFPWVSHTFTHAEMDFLSYQQARAEMELNINFAEARLPFDRQFLVTGKHSGLGWYRIADAPAGAQCVVDQVQDEFCQFGLEASNTAMLQAAEDLGVKYLAANRGWQTHVAECDSCLITHPLNSNIKLVPRWPTNIFFNTSTPEENTSEFNFLYGPGAPIVFFPVAQTWQQILDFEADIALRHILSSSPYPHYVHQANQREYTTGRSLVYDFSEAVLEEYSQYFSLPLISQDWAELTQTLEKRTSFFNAGASGVIDMKDNSIVSISSANGGTVFVTGVTLSSAVNTFSYGNKTISELQLAAGGTTNPTNPGNPTIPTPGNILTNGGFEGGLTAWSSCGSINTSTIVNNAVEGQNALTIGGNNVSGTCLFQEAEAVVGSVYTLSCQASRNAATSWSSMQLSFTTSTFAATGVSQLKEITGSSYSPVSITLTAPANAANIAVTLYSEDNASFDDCILTTGTVTPPPPPSPPSPTNSAPTIAAIPAQSTVQNTTIVLGVSAQDADNDTLSYSAVGLPEGISISPTTGIMTGKADIVGTSNVTVTVSDGTANASTSFTWSVTPETITPPPVTNLLINPDFESSLTGWDLSGCGAGTITTSSSVSSSGNSSLVLTGATVCAGQGITPEAGKTYTLSCDVRNVGSAYADMSLYADSTEIAIAELTGNTFNRTSISGTVPAGTSNLYVYFYHENSGSIYIDNCVLNSN